jgi:hypothetical protein
MTCSDKANCTFTCSGGNCNFRCMTSGDCNVSCGDHDNCRMFPDSTWP